MSVPTGSDKPFQYNPLDKVHKRLEGVEISKEEAAQDVTSFKTANVNWTDAAKQAAAKAKLSLDIKAFGEIELNDFSKYLRLQVGDAEIVWVNRQDALKLAEKMLPEFASKEGNKLERLCKEIDKIAKGPSSGIVITSATGVVKERVSESPKDVKELAATFGGQVTSVGSGGAKTITSSSAKKPFEESFTFKTLFEGWPSAANQLAKQKGVGIWIGDEKNWSAAAKEKNAKMFKDKVAISPLDIKNLTNVNALDLPLKYFKVVIGEAAPLWFKKEEFLELYKIIFPEEPNQKISESNKLNTICEYITTIALKQAPSKEGDKKQVIEQRTVKLDIASKEIDDANVILTLSETKFNKMLQELLGNKNFSQIVKDAIISFNSKQANNSLQNQGNIRNAQMLLDLDVLSQLLESLKIDRSIALAQRNQIDTLKAYLEIQLANLQRFLELNSETKIANCFEKYQKDKSSTPDIVKGAELAISAYTAIQEKLYLSAQIEQLSTASKREKDMMAAQNRQYQSKIDNLMAKLTLSSDLETKKDKLVNASRLKEAGFLSKWLRRDAAVELDLATILSVLKAKAEVNQDKNAGNEIQKIIKLFKANEKGLEHLQHLQQRNSFFNFLTLN